MGRARFTTRLTVEQCPIHLSAPALRRLGVFRISCGSGELTWRYEGSGPTLASLSYEIKTDERGSRTLLIHPRIIGVNPRWIVIAHSIPLPTTLPHFGGERYWFHCDCGERVGRLFLPEGRQEFQCRDCLNLAYRSVQRHDATVYAMARDEQAIDRALCSGVHRKALRGVEALTLRLKWMQRGRYDRL